MATIGDASTLALTTAHGVADGSELGCARLLGRTSTKLEIKDEIMRRARGGDRSAMAYVLKRKWATQSELGSTKLAAD